MEKVVEWICGRGQPDFLAFGGVVSYLRLLPEIQCWPTWIRNGKQFENVAPDSLHITSDLSAALCLWSREWDATYDLENDPGNPEFPSDDAERDFWRRGQRLSERLRNELGPEWTVESDPQSLDPII
ncbi:hypothetical protein AB0M34_16635 [Nocardia sp. NPDC050193]